jgi:ORF6N domain
MHIVPVETIQTRILFIRGTKVILDQDLARLYGTTTKRLNEQVKRNHKRFPVGFLFQLTAEEKREVVAICDHLKSLKFSSVLPYAFTEHGALMAATVLNTPLAIKVSVYIVQAFIELREKGTLHKDVVYKLNELEFIVGLHDEKIRSLFKTIRNLMTPKKQKAKRIGFSFPDK